MQERFKLIPSVYLLLVKEGKILLSQRANTGFEDGNYGLVAGHAEAGESMTAAMVREAKEEAGITIHVDDLREVVTMHRNCGDHERIDFFFTVEAWEGEPKNMEPHVCSDLDWFEIGNLPKTTIDYIREAIGCYESGKAYTEFGF